MKKNYLLLLLIIILISGSWNCRHQQEKTQGQSIRVISLAPHITEIIYAIGAQDNLIAVTDFCNYPEEARSKLKIGGLLNPNIELIITLKPTHIFGLPSHEKLDQELRKFGLTITMLPNENITDVLKTIEYIGKATGHNQQALDLVNRISNRFNLLREESLNKLHVSAALIIGREKGTLRNITVAGGDTFLDEIWQMCGGTNIFSDMPLRYGTISLESLMLKNPDIIIEFELKGKHEISRVTEAPEWNDLNNLHAVKNKNIFIISGDHTLIPGPRMVLLADDFTRIIDQLYIAGNTN